MVGLIIGYLVLVGAFIVYHLRKAPHLDDNGNIVKKETKTDNFLEFDEDEEFLS